MNGLWWQPAPLHASERRTGRPRGTRLMGGLLWEYRRLHLALGLLVAVRHEFGHFWGLVAAASGGSASIGFAGHLASPWQGWVPEYVLAWIPLAVTSRCWMKPGRGTQTWGGAILQQQNRLGPDGCIVAASPTANFVFALFAFWLVFMLPSVKSRSSVRCVPPPRQRPPLLPGDGDRQVGGEVTADWSSRYALVSHGRRCTSDRLMLKGRPETPGLASVDKTPPAPWGLGFR